jgi:hypothetical protein
MPGRNAADEGEGGAVAQFLHQHAIGAHAQRRLDQVLRPHASRALISLRIEQ